MKRVIFATAFVLVSSACQKTPEPTGSAPAPAPQPQVAASASARTTPAPTSPGALPPVEVTWLDPPAFRRSARPNPMRKATYEVPRATGDAEDGELGVFYFGPGQGGAIDANIDRWVKQFSDVPAERIKRADRSANGLRQHTVEIESGTYNASAMSQVKAKPKADFALLGAIVEAPSGMYFFKLTGPKATVAAARPSFYAMLDSVKPSGS